MIVVEQALAEESLQNQMPSEMEGICPNENNSEAAPPDEHEELRQQLQDALTKLHQAELTKEEILQNIEKTKKKHKYMLQFSAMVLVLASVIRFHQEMGQVGWNCLQTVTGFLGCSPEQLTGLILFLGAMYLLCVLLKEIISAAAEDMLDEEVFDHDLDHR